MLIFSNLVLNLFTKPHKMQNESVKYWYVYLLKCNDKSTYTGCTSNLKERLKRHKAGSVHYTKTRLPFDLVTYISFTDKYKAFHFEKYLKSGSGKAFANKRFL